MQASLDAIQVMGGDGVTPFYPLQEIMNVAKVENIAGGTMEACRLVIFRTALRQMADQLKMALRTIHPVLGVPVPTSPPERKETGVNEEKVLMALAEDYRVNPGLHMSREDLLALLDVDGATLDGFLISLETQGLIRLVRTKKGIELAKATYDGLAKAHPPEYYRWFPSWADKDRRF